MTEVVHNDTANSNLPQGNAEAQKGFAQYHDIASFSKAVELATGEAFDFASLMELQTDFVQASDQYLLLNLKEYGTKKADNFLFLSGDKAYAFSGNYPSPAAIQAFEDVLDKPFGKSTILCFLILNRILDNHKQQLEVLITRIRKLEDSFDHDEYRSISMEFGRFSDRLEEFHDLLLGLQLRRYKQVETQFIAFDYRVIIAESLSLLGRCRRRSNTLKEVRQDHEMLATEELNHRIVKLNDVVRRLTAITVILMLPTLIASHFGMNFAYMPELQISWVYPAVIIGQFALMIVGIIVFKKIGWL